MIFGHRIASVQYMQAVHSLRCCSTICPVFLFSPYYVFVADFFREINEKTAAADDLLKVRCLIRLLPCPTHNARKVFQTR